MRGNVHMRAGEVEQALAAYREAVKLAPEEASGRQLLANALQESGDATGAQSEYRRAMELSHPSSEVGVVSRRELAILLFHGGKPGEAKTLLREVLTHRRDDVFALNRLAELHAAAGEVDEASALLTAALARDPKNVSARLTQIRLAARAQRWDVAESLLGELDALRPGEAFVAYERAVVRVARNDLAGALTALETALRGATGAARAKTQADPRLSALAGHPRFLALTATGK